MKTCKFQSSQLASVLRGSGSRNRRGSILILSAIMLVGFVGLLALAIDVGYLMVAKTQLQQSADASALAACAELIDNEALASNPGLNDEITSARELAMQYAALNKVCSVSPVVNQNVGNASNGDVVIGSLSYPFPADQAMDLTFPNRYNAVQVTVRRTANSNGEVNLFFARLFGYGSRPLEANATAALVTNFGGFRAPGDGSNLELLPFALDIDTWNALMAGSITADN